ncbi:MAG: ATP synthase F0 subunit B [Acidobacteriota bacterium]|nr:ATP synthase F0 subunit B [Acidobacteriota bacterium]
MIPDLSTIGVVFLLLLCIAILNRMVFQPILAVIDQRTAAVRDARELAESAATKAAAAAEKYDQTLNAARAEVYAQIDATRRAALDKRAALLADTRASVEREIQDATIRVAQEFDAARSALDRDAAGLADAIVARVLGRAS